MTAIFVFARRNCPLQEKQLRICGNAAGSKLEKAYRELAANRSAAHRAVTSAPEMRELTPILAHAAPIRLQTYPMAVVVA